MLNVLFRNIPYEYDEDDGAEEETDDGADGGHEVPGGVPLDVRYRQRHAARAFALLRNHSLVALGARVIEDDRCGRDAKSNAYVLYCAVL